METPPLNPEHAWLEDFLLGRLDDEQQERAEEELRRSPALLDVLQELEGSHLPIEGVSGAQLRQAPADPTELPALMQRLALLRPVADTGHPVVAETISPETVPPAPLAELAFLAPPREPGEMGRLGGFRILQVLGAGGMGLVLRAEDTTIRRAVAMKVMKPGIAAQAGARDRFLREARLVADLDHENIATIHHVGEDRGVPFFTMPLLTGETLEARLQRAGTLPVEEVLRIGREAATGLAAAHGRGLVHRDIKPPNLWLFRRGDGTGPRDQVKILDFGLARPLDADVRLTSPNQLMGTPAYMSPEQVQNGAVGPSSDLFSLGAVLYRAATGRPAFSGQHLMELLQNVATGTPQPPHEVRPDLPPDAVGVYRATAGEGPGPAPGFRAGRGGGNRPDSLPDDHHSGRGGLGCLVRQETARLSRSNEGDVQRPGGHDCLVEGRSGHPQTAAGRAERAAAA